VGVDPADALPEDPARLDEVKDLFILDRARLWQHGEQREDLAPASEVAARQLANDPGMAQSVAAIEELRQFGVPPTEVVDPD